MNEKIILNKIIKKLKVFLLAIGFCILLINIIADSYSQYNMYECGMTGGEDYWGFGGHYKPSRTDRSGGQILNDSTAVFPVLIVFVQFKDDPYNDQWWWPRDSSPVYMDSLISPIRRNNTNWWDAYDEDTAMISDWWHEVSRGQLHVKGKAYNILLDSTAEYYNSNGGYMRINAEIWEKLKDSTLNIIWQDYDKWRYDENEVFHYESDGLVDMIYKIHRTHTQDNNFWSTAAGYGLLGYAIGDSALGYKVAPGVFIGGGNKFGGSGITFAGKFGIPQKWQVVGVVGHEVGHYLFESAGGIRYAKMTHHQGNDYFYSPWEMIKLEYMIPREVNFSNKVEYTLGDYSSRNSNDTGEVLQVQIDGSDEFFLLANRRNVSRWDRIMEGDTAHDNALRVINPEYGKGLYIYHITGGYWWMSYKAMDQECADGLYNWVYGGSTTPDWSNTQQVDYYMRSSVSYDNDISTTGANSRDDKSFKTYFNVGKRHTVLGGDGIDRISVNDSAIWTSRALIGDRWDGWNPGYNEIFSPYSSPSTNKWNNSNSGIFIWFYDLGVGGDETEASIRIYKVGSNGFDLDSILAVTPPSRPMNLKIENCDTNTIYLTLLRPKLTWNHNMEPDMIREVGGAIVKKYRIYRSVANDMNSIPPDSYSFAENVYTLLDSVLIDTSETPSYVDTSVISICNELRDQSCPPTCWVKFPARYRIQAVDENEDRSVLSDFAYTQAYKNDPNQGQGSGGEQDNPILEQNELPKEFALKQNFPNPFNPVTNIKFDLPKDVFVTIKIYDVLGREVAILVNELKKGGRYIVAFNGSKLSSGVYFYKIKAGLFSDIKRMVLVK